VRIGEFLCLFGIGSSSVISTSKTMKITAIKKNYDEKGSRAMFVWVKSTLEWGSFVSVFIVFLRD
jgi:hypothetical protein